MSPSPTKAQLQEQLKQLQAENSRLRKVLDQEGRAGLEDEYRSLEESEARFRDLAEMLPALVVEMDTRGTLIYANRYAFELSGYSEQDLRDGMQGLDFFVPEERERASDNIAQVLAGAVLGPQRYLARRKDGSTFPALVRSAPIVREGQVEGLRAIVLDITGRELAREALEASEARYRTLVEHLPAVVYRVQLGRGGIFYSPQTMELLGHAPEYLTDNPRAWQEAVHPEDRKQLDAAWHSLRRTPGFDLEYRIRHADGSWRWLHDRSFGREKHGNRIEFSGIATDITLRRRMEGEQEQRLQYEALLSWLATNFLFDSEEQLEELLDWSLEKVGRFTQVDRALLFQFSEDGKRISAIHEWCAPGVPRGPQTTIKKPVSAFSWSMDILRSEGILAVEDLSRVSETGPEEREAFQQAGVTAFVAAAIRQGEQLWGFTAVEMCGDTRTWEARIKYLLGHVAAIFANALLRARHVRLLEDSEERFRALFEQAGEGVFLHNLQGGFIEANRIACRRLGYSKEELLALHVKDVDPDFVVREDEGKFWKELNDTTPVVFEGRHRDKKGREFPVEVSLSPIRIAGQHLIMAVARDITDRKQHEQQLRTALLEKEILLKEVHHRVKNNLQLVASMLNLQTYYLEDEHLKHILQDSVQRIHSMGLIHQKLYQSANFAAVNIQDYLEGVVGQLAANYSRRECRVDLSIQCHDIHFGLDNAIPCGLLVNEIVTNSFKYAFVGRTEGRIAIQMRTRKNDYLLEIGDNGVGLPPEVDFFTHESLGFEIIRSLVQQLQGEVELLSRAGTWFRITFVGREAA